MFQRSNRLLGRCLSMGVAAAAMFGFAGCVSQGDYDGAVETARGAQNGKITAERERDEARAAADLMRNQLTRNEAALAELRDQNSQLRKALEDAGISLKDLQDRIGRVEFGPLDAQTDEALRALAAQYPDLIVYDPERGMLRFASDLTFDSGSDAVKDTARSSLEALARILSSGTAASYEVHIIGHTDSQRITSSTARQHPTNVHLSCHRAISVRKELSGMGVAPDKMLAAGWGEFRPAVENNANGNTPQNRRVEIFLARSTATGLSTPIEPMTTRAAPERTAPPTRQPEISK